MKNVKVEEAGEVSNGKLLDNIVCVVLCRQGYDDVANNTGAWSCSHPATPRHIGWACGLIPWASC